MFYLNGCITKRLHSTPPITKKKYAEIFLRYRWLFIKSNVVIGEWKIYGAELSFLYSRFFRQRQLHIGGVCVIPSGNKEIVFVQYLQLSKGMTHRDLIFTQWMA